MHVLSVDAVADLDPHAEAWEALAAGLPQCVPMLGHAWLSTYLEQQVEPAGRWFTLLAYDGDALQGVLTAVVVPSRFLGHVRPYLRVPLEYHTPEGDLVLRPGREGEAMRALLAGVRERVAHPLVLGLSGVREDSPTHRALADCVPGWSVTREFACHGSSWIVTGSVEDWFQGLSKNLRKDLKRCANRIRKDGLGDERVTFLAGPDASGATLDAFNELEASGWKGADGAAISTREEKLAKYRRLVRLYAARGMLEWHLLHLGDRLAAAHLAIRMGRNLMLLRQGFDDALGRYGVGNLLVQRMVEREFERGGDVEINLVTDYPWCRRWRMAEKRYDRVWLHPGGPLPWLFSRLPIRTRGWLRSVPAVQRLRAGRAGWPMARSGRLKVGRAPVDSPKGGAVRPRPLRTRPGR